MVKNERLIDKVAIVTGGASGIGKAICLFLAQHGTKVIIADNNLDGAKENEAYFSSQGHYGKAAYADVSNPQDVKSLIQNTMDEYGRIDFLFNNAGIGINGEFSDLTFEMWKHVLDVNLWSTIYGCHFIYPIMKKQGFGHIINTASLAGLIPGLLNSPYSASKYAVVGFSLTLRAEAKQFGINVSTLCPGYLKTNIQKSTLIASDYLKAEENKKRGENLKVPTPEKCINQMMRGVLKNKAIIMFPRNQRILWFFYRIAPASIPYIFSRIISNLRKAG